MLVAIAVFVFTNVYAAEEVDLKIIPSSSFLDVSVYSINNPITQIPNPYEGNRRLGFSIFLIEQGHSKDQWDCINALWGKYESSWNNTAQNPKSTAFGVAQFLNSTWAGTGYEKTSDPEYQIRAGIIYTENRYGTACYALQERVKKGWY